MFLAVVLVFLNCHNLFTSQIANFNVLSFPGSLSPNWVTAILDDAGDELAIIIKPGINSISSRSVNKALASSILVVIISTIINRLLRRNLARTSFCLICTSASSNHLAVNFVGDGINDAPVLTRADIGFAMGSMGSDAAIEAADIVIMDDDIHKISKVIDIARKTLSIVKTNIVFAIGIKFVVLDADLPVLSSINFTAEPGQITAFIGSTGSGKSTLINLISRFYDVSAGQILLDGVDIRQLKLEDLYDQIGYVPQKGVLFSGTIASNIKYGNVKASQKLVEKSAKIAQAAEFISELKNGYKNDIAQGGSNVSGGQRQRLSIARAIAVEPNVYIFDDSFSALDFKTDAKLRSALAKKTKHKTVHKKLNKHNL